MPLLVVRLAAKVVTLMCDPRRKWHKIVRPKIPCGCSKRGRFKLNPLTTHKRVLKRFA